MSYALREKQRDIVMLSGRFAIPLLLSGLIFFPLSDSKCADLHRFPGSIFEQDDYFPLGVWLQIPENAERYKELGINLYVGLWKGPTKTQLARLKKANMPALTAMNDVGLKNADNDVIVGWLMQDEPDNAQKILGSKEFGPPIPPAIMSKRYQRIQQRDPSRPVMINLGQGVAWDQWYGRGVRTNHSEDYIGYAQAGDIISFDIYPVTHQSPEVAGRLDLVAKGVDRLVHWTGGRKPIWSVIGASRINNSDILPTGDEVRRQVWLSIIHGSQGIIYFVHQFKPKFVEAGLLQHKNLSAAVKNINARITSLARILNSAQVEDAVIVEGTSKVPAVTALVKQDQCHLYIFAGSKSGLATDATFHVKQIIGDLNIEVLDESRTVQIENMSFQDDFGPYAVHLYKLKKGASNCL